MHFADHPTPSASTTTFASKRIPTNALGGGETASNVPATINITDMAAIQRQKHVNNDRDKDGDTI